MTARSVAPAQDREATATRERTAADAATLTSLLRDHPDGLTESDIRGHLRAAGHRWGVERLNAARVVLMAGHAGWQAVDVGTGQRRCWRVDAVVEVFT